MNFLTIALSVCMSPHFVNESNEAANKKNLENLTVAERGCKNYYQSCLKTFIKKDVNRYWAICSKE